MPRVRAEYSVLVVIDTQPGFYLDRTDVDQTEFAGFVDRVSWITAVARSLGIPTVVSVERPERNGPTAEQVASALAADTPIFEKTTFSVAADSSLRTAIEVTSRPTAVLVGMETDVCVAQSAMGLADTGCRVVVISDATYSPGDAHDHGLERMRGAGIELVSAKALFYEWLPSVDQVRHFKHAHPDLARPAMIQL